MRHMMRRCGGLAVLLGLSAALAGCVYDPYTGGYYPCCAYPYHPYAVPYDRYPACGYPAQPGYPPPPGYSQPPPR
ncbi:MAG TPA: hypothetical protein VND19_14485 [Acetobacteraceae bacterium]|nr:hypothetical protein [Acetobacteraceae bacterium]